MSGLITNWFQNCIWDYRQELTVKVISGLITVYLYCVQLCSSRAAGRKEPQVTTQTQDCPSLKASCLPQAANAGSKDTTPTPRVGGRLTNDQNQGNREVGHKPVMVSFLLSSSTYTPFINFCPHEGLMLGSTG